MRLNPLNGKAVMGAGGSDLSVDGATPAALVGIVGGTSVYGPAWLSATEFVFRNGGAGGSGPWNLSKYNTGTTAITAVNVKSSNDVAASILGKWALWLNDGTTGVVTNVGVGPFPSGALGDVSSDYGELAIIDSYPAQVGLTIYSAGGAVLLALPTVTLVTKFVRIRGHILAYQTAADWQLADVTGAAFTYCVRINEPINWITPVRLASGRTLLLERSNRLTLRYADRGAGWEIQPLGNVTFNPDVIEVSAGVVRMAWSTNAGESAAALVVANLVVATGVLTISTVVAGVLVPGAPTTLTPQTFPVGPAIGTGGLGAGTLPLKAPVTDTDRRMTKEWVGWAQNLTQGQANNTQAIAAIPPAAPPPGFGTIRSGTQPPIAATQPNDAVEVVGTGGLVLTTNQSTKVLTIDGTVAGVSRAQILAIASLRA